MIKAEIELESSVELILVIIGIVLVLILITAIILNIQSIGEFFKESMGELF
jgi:hypothetical protein